MGRRPNPLVVEFFERGPKVSDNSNRYEHTCKRCGAVFPKGRIDSLINHLLRKCPQVTDQDRQLVFQHISSVPVQQQPAETQAAITQTPLMLRHEDLPEVSLPAQSALDTLAEVSRRHLDYSSNAAPAAGEEQDRGKTLSEILAEQVLITELSNYVDPPSGHTQVSHEKNSAVTATFDVSPLVQAATAASQQLELAQATRNAHNDQNDLPLDPQLNGTYEPNKLVEGMNDFANADTESMMTWIPKRVKRLKDPPKVPSGAPTPGFELLQLPKAGQKRKRFDVDRRKEVSNLRKQGACIRCRMLKKPCSGDNPCSTCQNVQTARVWKVKCLRTRLADEFTLWSSNLFQTRMNAAVSATTQELGKSATPGRVEVHFPNVAEKAFSVAAKAYGNTASSLIEGPLKLILLNDGDASFSRLEQYSDQLINARVENEPSAFIKGTLKQAQVLVNAEADAKAANEANSKRSCYALQDQMLKNVLELWAMTRLLTSPSDAPWSLQFTPTQAKQRKHHDDDVLDEPRLPEVSKIPESSLSHSLIISQLQASVEARCSNLSKIIMNELERRLLQRQQVSPFATFLSAIILLACVERMTGLFRSFDAEGGTDDPLHNHGETVQADEVQTHPENEKITSDGTPASTHLQSSSWPLASPPSTHWTQGQNFAELLAMLLRMRALPPKTNTTPLGTLSANPAFDPPLRINGRPVQEQVESQTKAAQAWLDPLRLNVAELVEKRNKVPGRDEGVDAWEMRFVSMLLLPENVVNASVG